MNIVVAAVGRLKEPYLAAAEAEYVKRLRPYAGLRVVESKDESGLVSALPTGCHLYAFDERGELLTSHDFAHGVLGAEEQHGGGAAVVFAIGGADGHSDRVRREARRVLSFGRLTIAHRLVRILVLEQIYRGYRILRGQPYHRD